MSDSGNKPSASKPASSSKNASNVAKSASNPAAKPASSISGYVARDGAPAHIAARRRKPIPADASSADVAAVAQRLQLAPGDAPALRRFGPDNAPPIPKSDKPRPPFWDVQRWGEPEGDFLLQNRKGAAGGARGGYPAPVPTPVLPPQARNGAQIGPQGVQGAASQAGHRGGDASAGRPLPQADQPAAKHSPDKLPNAEKLLDKMAQHLKKKRTLHKGERVQLMDAFQVVDLHGQGLVNVGAFVTAWQLLGLSVSEEEARAIFGKCGRDAHGRMPVEVFVNVLLAGPAKLLGYRGIQQGPFKPGQPVNGSDKVMYPQCKKGVFPPSNWDMALLDRSARLPNAALTLEFVYGYSGIGNLANNLFLTSTGELAYYVAAVGIVYNREAHAQRLFREHSDDIKSMAMHPNGQLVATGQVGKLPYLCVWDASSPSCAIRQKITLPPVRGVVALSFSPRGDILLAIGSDDDHTVYGYKWEKTELVIEGKGMRGTPPYVYGAVWDPFQPSLDYFVTYGVNHVKQWSPAAAASTGRAPAGGRSAGASTQYRTLVYSFGTSKPFVACCACFLPAGELVVGTESGQLAVFRNEKLQRLVPAHKDLGAKAVAGLPSARGVRVLHLDADHKCLLSGGADGAILVWDVSQGVLGDLARSMQLQSPFGFDEGPPKLRGLARVPGTSKLFIGTHRCDIWEVDLAASPPARPPSVVMYGHSADVYAVAAHPQLRKAHLFVTGSDAGRVFVWDAAKRRLLRTAAVREGGVRSVDISPDGAHVALGLTGGGLQILDFAELQPVAWRKVSAADIDVIRYSPDGRLLAYGCHDTHIEVFDVAGNLPGPAAVRGVKPPGPSDGKGYRHMGRCSGHSATIRHLDWSVDSRVLMSGCAGYELLFWNAAKCSQLKSDQRDTLWHTWTSTLGFPVMGIWMDGSDGTDINALARAGSQRVLALADDYGKVRLLNFPCVIEDAPARIYGGHSSHVMGVTFTCDDRWVVTAGSMDRAVFQWRTHNAVAEASGVPVPNVPRCELDACVTCGGSENDRADGPGAWQMAGAGVAQALGGADAGNKQARSREEPSRGQRPDGAMWQQQAQPQQVNQEQQGQGQGWQQQGQQQERRNYGSPRGPDQYQEGGQGPGGEPPRHQQAVRQAWGGGLGAHEDGYRGYDGVEGGQPGRHGTPQRAPGGMPGRGQSRADDDVDSRHKAARENAERARARGGGVASCLDQGLLGAHHKDGDGRRGRNAASRHGDEDRAERAESTNSAYGFSVRPRSDGRAGIAQGAGDGGPEPEHFARKHKGGQVGALLAWGGD